MRSIPKDCLVSSDRAVHASELVGVILQRASHLDPLDHILLMAVLDRGMPTAELAKLLGVPPRRLRRRIAMLCKHLASPRFVAAMRVLPHLSERQGEAVRLHVLRNHSLREIARQWKTTVHFVRMKVVQAQAVIQERQERRSPARPKEAEADQEEAFVCSDSGRAV